MGDAGVALIFSLGISSSHNMTYNVYEELKKISYCRDRLQHTEVDADEAVEVLVRKAEALHVKVHLSITAQVRNLLGQNSSAQDQWTVVQKGRKGGRRDCQRDRSSC